MVTEYGNVGYWALDKLNLAALRLQKKVERDPSSNKVKLKETGGVNVSKILVRKVADIFKRLKYI